MKVRIDSMMAHAHSVISGMTHSQMSSSLAPGNLSTSSAPIPNAKTFRVSMNWLKFSPKAFRAQGQLYSENACTQEQQLSQRCPRNADLLSARPLSVITLEDDAKYTVMAGCAVLRTCLRTRQDMSEVSCAH